MDRNKKYWLLELAVVLSCRKVDTENGDTIRDTCDQD